MDDQQKQQQTQQPVQNPVSVTPGGKEQGTMPGVSSSEWVVPSSPEVHIPQELEKHMEKTPVPAIPQDVQHAGVSHAKEATPVVISSDDNALGLNSSPTLLASIKQTHGVKDAVRWLVELIGLSQSKRDREIEKGGRE